MVELFKKNYLLRMYYQAEELTEENMGKIIDYINNSTMYKCKIGRLERSIDIIKKEGEPDILIAFIGQIILQEGPYFVAIGKAQFKEEFISARSF